MSMSIRSSSKVKPISYLKANAAEVAVNTPNGDAKAVPQDVASFEETEETLAPLKTPAIGNRDVAARKLMPVADLIARPRASEPLSAGRRTGKAQSVSHCGAERDPEPVHDCISE
jgi:hypothetical protein